MTKIGATKTVPGTTESSEPQAAQCEYGGEFREQRYRRYRTTHLQKNPREDATHASRQVHKKGREFPHLNSSERVR